MRFYSYVPKRRAQAFGLPAECHVSLLPFAAPFLSSEYLTKRALDFGLQRRLQPCDVLIAMSGVYVSALKQARRRYGAAVWLERSSQHILAQDDILAATPGAARPSRDAIARELSGYAIADRISVPSTPVLQSFDCDPEAKAKLFQNPFGVDLAAFPSRKPLSNEYPFTLLFVGTWSLRKGADILTRALQLTPEVSLLHVGAITDHPFPDGERFRHVDTVPQSRLGEFYAQAHAFILLSREEGLAVVQPQALASGLPIICSDRTGGADLRHTAALSERITTIPHDDVGAAVAAIIAARDRHREGWVPSPLTDSDRQTLSWRAYAERYSAELLRCFTPKHR